MQYALECEELAGLALRSVPKVGRDIEIFVSFLLIVVKCSRTTFGYRTV
jgi:hypothetical protein